MSKAKKGTRLSIRLRGYDFRAYESMGLLSIMADFRFSGADVNSFCDCKRYVQGCGALLTGSTEAYDFCVACWDMVTVP